MRTTNGAFSWCDRLPEAGILTAVLSVPLFFNSYSLRSFEPDKAALLRSLAVLIALGWIAKVAASALRGDDGRYGRRLRRPAADRRSIPVLFALGFLAAVAVATGLSIAPFESLWGSYQRQQGLLTTAAYGVIFLSLIGLMRERLQIERIITALLLACVGIGVYGVLQQSGLDPIRWTTPGRSPIRSTMGNEIFIAAFLIMTIPLTALRLSEAATDVAATARHPRAAVRMFGGGVIASASAMIAGWWISMVAGAITAALVGALWAAAALLRRVAFRECARGYAYSVLISLQLACTLLAESRGPFLGLLAGLFTLALLVAAVLRKRHWMMALMGLAATALGVLVLANVPGSPLHALQDVPTVGRLTKVLTTEGPAQVRLLIWGGSAELFTQDPGRVIVGYGPETFRLAMAPHYRAELGPLTDRASWPDRAHNQTFDLLIETGVIGASVYYALVLSLVHLALRQLGVLATTREGWSFIGLSVAGAAAAAGGAHLIDASWRFLGLSPTAGILIGMTAFLVRAGLRPQPREQDPHIRTSQWWPRWLIMCLLAALVAHLVEVQVGIATVSTHFLFWTYAALLISVVRQGDFPRSAAARSPGTDSPPAVLLVGLAVLTLSFAFSPTGSEEAVSLGFAWAFAGCLAVWGLVAFAEIRGQRRRDWSLLEFTGFFGAVALLSMMISRLVFNVVPERWSGFVPATPAYFILVLTFVFVLAAALTAGSGPQLRAIRLRSALTGAALFLIALALGWKGNFEAIQADVVARQGRLAQLEANDPDRAISAYRAALRLAPHQDMYHTFLGSAFSDMALSPSDEPRMLWFDRAEEAFERARRLSPLDPDHLANLARLYWRWAEETGGAEAREDLLTKALVFYRTAAEMSPQRTAYWTDIGAIHAGMGDLRAAAAALERSFALDRNHAETASMLGHVQARRTRWTAAAHALARALEIEPERSEDRLALAGVYEHLGRTAEARRMYELILQRDTDHATARGGLKALQSR